MTQRYWKKCNINSNVDNDNDNNTQQIAFSKAITISHLKFISSLTKGWLFFLYFIGSTPGKCFAEFTFNWRQIEQTNTSDRYNVNITPIPSFSPPFFSVFLFAFSFLQSKIAKGLYFTVHQTTIDWTTFSPFAIFRLSFLGSFSLFLFHASKVKTNECDKKNKKEEVINTKEILATTTTTFTSNNVM